MLESNGFPFFAGSSLQQTQISGEDGDSGSQFGGGDDGPSMGDSKYMSFEELESIRKEQFLLHLSDPYADDYYSQACRDKRMMNSCPWFFPTSIPGLPPAEGDHLPSSIRRPRALLEAGDPKNARLEQEPLFAARVSIEDAHKLLLQIDDIDRRLRRVRPKQRALWVRRKLLLEGLAGSLDGELVFRRVVAIPKGRKLLSRFLQRLPRGNELAGGICLAVMRNLRSLFGDSPESKDLATAVASCVESMDLRAQSAFLAAVVCSREYPLFLPLGGSAGEGASVILHSVLRTATAALLAGGEDFNHYPTRLLWQISFDAFFGVVLRQLADRHLIDLKSPVGAKRKPEKALVLASHSSSSHWKDMPMEMLFACLPHTNESQRKMLTSFGKMVLEGTNAHQLVLGPHHPNQEPKPKKLNISL